MLAPTKKARMCSHEPSLFPPCSSFSPPPPTADAPRSSRLRFMRFSQPKQIVKTLGGVQSHACYRKINDISIGDFSQTRNIISPSVVSRDGRAIFSPYDVFPHFAMLSIDLVFFFHQEEHVNFVKGSVFKMSTRKGVKLEQ